MSAKLVVEIKPQSSIAQELLAHHVETLGKNSGAKMRRTVVAGTTHLTRSHSVIVLNQPGELSDTKDLTYTVTVHLASKLVSPEAMTENPLFKPATCVLPLFRTALKEILPEIEDEIVAGITAEDCEIREVTATYYFEYPSESATFQGLCKLYQHCLVCLTSSDPYPGTKSRTKALAPRLRSIDDDSHALSIDLMHLPAQEQFGQARVYLMRDPSAQPKSFAHQTPQQRESLRASARCLLCVDVTTYIGKNLHYGDDKNFKLPSDYRRWTPEHMQLDPFLVIWEATRYALWLNLPMPTEASEIDLEMLNQGEREVLQGYLEGQNLRHNQWIENTEALLNYRRILLQKVGVDVLMPWAIAKLNLCQELGEQLTYANRFRPSKDSAFTTHCLSNDNAADLASALLEKLPEFAKQEGDLRLPDEAPEEGENPADPA